MSCSFGATGTGAKSGGTRHSTRSVQGANKNLAVCNCSALVSTPCLGKPAFRAHARIIHRRHRIPGHDCSSSRINGDGLPRRGGGEKKPPLPMQAKAAAGHQKTERFQAGRLGGREVRNHKVRLIAGPQPRTCVAEVLATLPGRSLLPFKAPSRFASLNGPRRLEDIPC